MGRSPDDVALVVNGVRYTGWKSIRVTRSIDSFAGSFALDVSDRWGDHEPWPIMEDDACRVEIGNGTDTEIETVIDGYISKRDISIDASLSRAVVRGSRSRCRPRRLLGPRS
jgi:prophage tail gpP-like protein